MQYDGAPNFNEMNILHSILKVCHFNFMERERGRERGRERERERERERQTDRQTF